MAPDWLTALGFVLFFAAVIWHGHGDKWKLGRK